MKQTAVDWFAEKVGHNSLMGSAEYYEILEQAKQMEKDNTKKLLEIIMWYDEQSDVRPNTEIYTWFEQYYNEIFKSE